MFTVNELYLQKSKKKNNNVVRVLDEAPNANGQVRVQFISQSGNYASLPANYVTNALKTNQSIQMVSAKSIKETVAEFERQEQEAQDSRPEIQYVNEAGQNVSKRDYEFRDSSEAERLELFEGTITLTCHSCKSRISTPLSKITTERNEQDCELCGVHLTIEAHVPCPQCGLVNEVDLYDS